MCQIFISYSRKDIHFVRHLAKQLEEASFDVWWDTSDLAGGDTWTRNIQAALRKSEYCIVVLSPDSMESVWVEKEYTYAIGLGIKIIPILYRDCELPMALSNVHYIDFQRDCRELGLQQLLAVLKASESPVIRLSPTRRFLKRKLWAALRDPIWQMIGVIVAVITFGWGVYIFSIESNPAAYEVTPTHTMTTVALGPTATNSLSKLQESDTPTSTKIPVSPTFTQMPTETEEVKREVDASATYFNDFTDLSGWILSQGLYSARCDYPILQTGSVVYINKQGLPNGNRAGYVELPEPLVSSVAETLTVEIKFRYDDYGGFNIGLMKTNEYACQNASNDGFVFMMGGEGSDKFQLLNEFGDEIDVPTTHDGNWHIAKLVRSEAGYWSMYIDDVYGGTGIHQDLNTHYRYLTVQGYASNTALAEIDYISVAAGPN